MPNEEALETTLFSPYKMGKSWELAHRVVMAPLTRCRALNHLPNQAHVEYYSQRATRGGLLLSEGTVISSTGHGYPNTPGIYTDEQVEAWKKVTAAVHAKGGIIICQLWHVGRSSNHVYQPEGHPPISSTTKKIADKWKLLLPDGTYGTYSQPKPITTTEVSDVVNQFRQAAINSIQAGFDEVEIHGAYGFLIDQFLKDAVNDRTDNYGGTLHNRCRFLTEILDAVVEVIGADKVGVKISPTSNYEDCYDSDPIALGLAVVERLNEIQERVGTRLTHLHIQVDPVRHGTGDEEARLLRALRKAYDGTLMLIGGFCKESGMKVVGHGEADLVGFGRLFLSNPDLVRRFEMNAELNDYDGSTFYTSDPVVGYTDYPFLCEQ